MNDKSESTSKVPWAFWVVAGIGLLFNLAGAANYISQTNPETVAAMPDGYRAIIESRPAWATGAFATAVFAGVLGCILLLLKKTPATYVLTASLLGAVGTIIHTIGAAPVEFVIGNVVQLLVTGFLIWYAKRAETKGWMS